LSPAPMPAVASIAEPAVAPEPVAAPAVQDDEDSIVRKPSKEFLRACGCI
jgi:hypothetical protein